MSDRAFNDRESDEAFLHHESKRLMILNDLKRADHQVQNTKADYENACRLRKALVLEALRDMSASDIGRALGVSRARIHQLRKIMESR